MNSIIYSTCLSLDRNNSVYYLSDGTSPPITTVKEKVSLTDAPTPIVTTCGPPYEDISVPTINFSRSPLTSLPTDSMSSSSIDQNHISSSLTTAKNFLEANKLLATPQRSRDDSGISTSGSFSTNKPSNASKQSYDESEIFTSRNTAHKQKLHLSSLVDYSQNEHYDETKVPVMSPKMLSDFPMDDEQQMKNNQIEFIEAIKTHPDMIQ